MNNYLRFFPQPFLEDLVRGNCIPFIGAGFSRNAEIPDNCSMPLWDDLGKGLAEMIPDYGYSGAIDAISAFEYEYSRAKLVEKLTELLLVNKVKPGNTHKAFCEMPFEVVITTNLEFLIERGYEAVHRYCFPVVEEDRLAVFSNGAGVELIKIHGDLHHPKHLIVTEDDYDLFIEKYPLFATYLANLLISKTALFIGYSLDDPDMRHIWQVVGERLGKLRRLAYTIMVNAKPHIVARFERRGIKVINIVDKENDYPYILEQVFIELRKHWETQLLQTSVIAEENLRQELVIPSDSENRLCYFVVPSNMLSFYRSYVFPIVEELGFSPITADEIISNGDTILAKTSALINRSSLIVVDTSSNYTLRELNMIRSRKFDSKRILIISDESMNLIDDIAEYRVLRRNKDLNYNSEYFLEAISLWFQQQSREFGPIILEEAKRLLKKGEYRAAVVSVITTLEKNLREILEFNFDTKMVKSLKQLIELAISKELIPQKKYRDITEWLVIRNKLVHSDQEISSSQARKIVNEIYTIIEEFNNRFKGN